MNRVLITAGILAVAVTAFIYFSGSRSLDDLANLVGNYPLQVFAYTYNVGGVVAGYWTRSFYVVYVIGLIDLILSGAVFFMWCHA